ncbi:hypothetical protein J7K41_03355 [Candidatus Micrarchaeota archaeon]|nr:hypothetical protein [Candidatus Micrarchaeota archaeon]
MLPFLTGILLLVSLISVCITTFDYSSVFTGNELVDSFIGAILGSISIGNPMTSYIIGGELLKSGISLIAVTSFIVAWVTVGVIQLPYEMNMLGKRFAILRNILAFISTIIVAVVTVFILSIIKGGAA